MKLTRTRAIVLKRTNYGESDRILQLLTPDGKVSAMVHGARKEKSKLAGGIELFSICDVVLCDGKSEMYTMTSARLVRFYRHIIEDYDRMQFAYLVIKLVSSASESVDGSEWYDVLSEVLKGLDVHTIPLKLIQTWFYLRYSIILGYGLSLDFDINGEKLSPEKNYRYDNEERGLRAIDNGELTSDHIKLLRLISTKPLNALVQIGGINSVLTGCLSVAQEHAAVS